MTPAHRVLTALMGSLVLTFSIRQVNFINTDPRKTWISKVYYPEPHPVEVLVKEANKKFEHTLKRQSETLSQAITEYKRRYQMSPPPGFDAWFDFAKQSDSLIIDDYDTMTDPFRPFWGLSSDEVNRRLQMIGDERIANFSIRDHQLIMPSDPVVIGNFQPTIKRWIENHLDILPDMDVIMNGLAEPRIIIPHDELSHLLTTWPSASNPSQANEKTPHHRPIEWLDLSRTSAWDIDTRSCPLDSPSRSSTPPSSHPNPSSFPLPFVTNITHAKSWCDQPSAAYTHGLFLSPYNLRLTSTLLPIFTHGKPSTAQDLLYPPPDYASPSPPPLSNTTTTTTTPQNPNTEDETLPWANKSSTFYWAGSDTGGYATPSTWRSLHRQRFVSLLTNTLNPTTFLTPLKPSLLSPWRWSPFPSTIAALSSLIKVHFTSLTLCTAPACSAQRRTLPLAPPDSPNEIRKHKYLFDIDGFGRTSRFYTLLSTGSCVLKQTMMREWHDDRLVPWAHYIPLSLGMEEVPELVRWLGTTEEGLRVGKMVGEGGRWWRGRVGREVDLEVAFLRGMLEWGRVVRGEERGEGRWRKERQEGRGRGG